MDLKIKTNMNFPLVLIRRYLICFLVLTFGFTSLGFAEASLNLPLEAYGLDTVAGFNTYLRTSKTLANSNVIFEVTDPNGEIVALSAVSNANGVAQVEFSNYNTRRAGEYLISARLSNASSNGRFNSFYVHPGDLSMIKSKVDPENQVVRSYGDSALINVQLFDDYLNSIEGHLVKLISTSGDDYIEYVGSSTTDSNGKIAFSVTSEVSGAVTYSVYDVTADVILDQRAKVAYFESGNYIFSSNTPSNFYYAASGNSSSFVDRLEFENVPQSIASSNSITFALTAYDAQDEVVQNYDGEVRFSVADGDSSFAVLPDDYTFTPQDLGTHTFSLAMMFLEDGTYKVEARDVDNIDVYGEYEFIVGTVSDSGSSDIKITNPAAGTSSNGVQVVSGKASSGASLKIYDNDIEIGSTVADASGAFSFTTSSLVDGQHEIYVAEVNEVGTVVSTSKSVKLTIDTSGPDVSQVVLEPSDVVDPGDIVNVKLYTSDDLSQAAVLFQDNIYEMTKSTEGYYEGSFAAPIEFGEYKVGFVLVDQLGNESKLENQAVVNVGGILSQDDAATVPDVKGLQAQPSDHRVTLTWDLPKSLDVKIKNYRVYYGISPNQLTEAVDTLTDANTWYIPNLKNGVEYYFAVIAVNDKGTLSERFSNIVSAVPNPIVSSVAPPEVTLGSAGSEAINDLQKDPSEAGPEMVWLLILSLWGGFAYVYFNRRKRASFEEVDFE